MHLLILEELCLGAALARKSQNLDSGGQSVVEGGTQAGWDRPRSRSRDRKIRAAPAGPTDLGVPPHLINSTGKLCCSGITITESTVGVWATDVDHPGTIPIDPRESREWKQPSLPFPGTQLSHRISMKDFSNVGNEW